MSCFIPYATLYSYHLGLAPSQVGLIWGLEPLVSFLCSPLWGSIADKYSKHKQIFMSFLVIGSVLYMSLLFVPPANLSTPVQSSNANCTVNTDVKSCLIPKIDNANDAYIKFCETMCMTDKVDSKNFSSFVCDDNGSLINCDICLGDDANVQTYLETTANDTVTISSPSAKVICNKWSNNSCDSLKCCNCEDVLSEDSGSLLLTFGLCICLVLVGTVFQSITIPFIDALCFGILAEKGRGDYGKQRMWGAVGWGIFAFISGLAVDKYNQNLNSDRTHYDPIFYMYISFAALTFLCTVFTTFPPHKAAERLGKSLWLVLKKAYVIAYFILVGIMGIGFGISGAFLFLFMDELNSTYLIMGLSMTITTLTEIPCFFISGPIIRRIGHNGTFCLTCVAYFFRFLGYSFAPNAWVVLPFQVFHGVTFGLFWAAATSYATLIAPQGMIATLQTMCSGIYFGIGEYYEIDVKQN